MKLSISNIAWDDENDELIYETMQRLGFEGVEIAPSKLFSNTPYDNLQIAAEWSQNMRSKYGFSVPSMQSIWFGRTENIFQSADERKTLLDYTKRAIWFAEEIKCKNLVFGCPRNRSYAEGTDLSVAIDFFGELGDYALAHHTVIGMEANPAIYHTNFINTTKEAMELIEKVNSKGFRLNLDLGTVIYNQEGLALIEDHVGVINHVHISEPYLAKIERRELHKKLHEILSEEGYKNFVSIEMSRQDNIESIEEVMIYTGDIFR